MPHACVRECNLTRSFDTDYSYIILPYRSRSLGIRIRAYRMRKIVGVSLPSSSRIRRADRNVESMTAVTVTLNALPSIIHNERKRARRLLGLRASRVSALRALVRNRNINYRRLSRINIPLYRPGAAAPETRH